ncbi:MAG: TetR/AcrR family transcriptional regulator [Dehalococcoidia bacterium]
MLNAARKVFREKGFEGATIADIVRDAGVAQGTFYIYYSSKRAAAVALRDELMDRMATAVVSAMQSNTSFEERLESLVSNSFQVARQNADLFKLAFIGADETHQELHSESPEHAVFLNITTDLFRSAVDAGEMETMDPEMTARLVLGLLQHAIIEAFVSGDGQEAEDLQKAVKILLSNALVKTG